MRTAKRKVIRTRRCKAYDYDQVDVIHADPAIQFVCSDGLIRLVAKELWKDAEPKNRQRVMLVFTIAETLVLAAKLNELAVKVALEE